MENNILDEKTSVPGNLSFDNESIKNLKEGRGWAMFMAILGFIGVGLMIIMAFVMFFASSFFGSQIGFPGAILGLVYLVMAGIMILPPVYLFKFAQKAGEAFNHNDNLALSEAIKNLKTHFKVKGIMYIALIALYIIIIFVAMAVGLSSAF